MIDRKAYERVYPHHSIYLWPSGLMDMENGEHLELSDDELAICHYEVPGFSFAHKRWCFFRVTNIQEIEYNLDAFGFLQLPEGQKEIIHSLVKVHKDDRLVFDDVIKGKGKGMVFLLHGTPGTGKTLTAGACFNRLYENAALNICNRKCSRLHTKASLRSELWRFWL